MKKLLLLNVLNLGPVVDVSPCGVGQLHYMLCLVQSYYLDVFFSLCIHSLCRKAKCYFEVWWFGSFCGLL